MFLLVVFVCIYYFVLSTLEALMKFFSPKFFSCSTPSFSFLMFDIVIYIFQIASRCRTYEISRLLAVWLENVRHR